MTFAAGESKTVKTFRTPSDNAFHLVLSHMAISASGSGVYNHMIGGRTVRSTEKNGGGSTNFAIFGSDVTVTIAAYVDIACDVSVSYECIRL